MRSGKKNKTNKKADIIDASPPVDVLQKQHMDIVAFMGKKIKQNGRKIGRFTLDKDIKDRTRCYDKEKEL